MEADGDELAMNLFLISGEKIKTVPPFCPSFLGSPLRRTPPYMAVRLVGALGSIRAGLLSPTVLSNSTIVASLAYEAHHSNE